MGGAFLFLVWETVLKVCCWTGQTLELSGQKCRSGSSRRARGDRQSILQIQLSGGCIVSIVHRLGPIGLHFYKEHRVKKSPEDNYYVAQKERLLRDFDKFAGAVRPVLMTHYGFGDTAPAARRLSSAPYAAIDHAAGA
jgi:hypothetical protein